MLLLIFLKKISSQKENIDMFMITMWNSFIFFPLKQMRKNKFQREKVFTQWHIVIIEIIDNDFCYKAKKTHDRD